jgi:hypothetical protein
MQRSKCKSDCAAHRVAEDIASGDVQPIENGNHIIGAVHRGVRTRLVRPGAVTMTAAIDEYQAAAASLEALDIPDLAPGRMAVGETVQQNEGSASSDYVVSNRRSISG